MTDELTTRLQNSTSEVSLADEVKAAHLSAISEALAGAPVVPLDRVSRRRKIIAAFTAAALIGPTGLAAASGDALPGETLYGVKQVSEHVTSLFDPDVIARHRIEEAEALAMLGRRSEDAITKAADAVSGLPEDHALRQRLAALAAEDDSEQDPDPDRVAQPAPDDDDTSDDDDDTDDSTDDTGDDTSDTDDDDTDDAGQPDDSDDFDDDSGDEDEGDEGNGDDDFDDDSGDEDDGDDDFDDDFDDDSGDGDDDFDDDSDDVNDG